MTQVTASQPSAHLRALPRRRPKYSSRAFFLTLLAISILSALSFITARGPAIAQPSSSRHWRRHSDPSIEGPNEECKNIHAAKDKCAFVKANCFDEEAGIFSYLSLYYCRLPHAQPFAFALLTLWLGLLFSTIGIAASDFFCVNLSTISNLLGMSESLAGVTFLAFGNGSPDVFSTFAAMSTNSGSLALGELIGAASFISAVVAGSMAIVRPFKVGRKSFIRDVVFFTLAVSFSMVFLYDGKLYLWECLTMVGFYCFYVASVVIWHWSLTRRRRRRQKEAAMRSHFVIPGGEEEDALSEYHDEEEGERVNNGPNDNSSTDLRVLERGPDRGYMEYDEDDEEAAMDRWLGEISSNMRVSRPRLGGRRNTHTPIRPSLVGALEFRSVLSSLKKSRNIQTIPINLRRYSDDPNFTTVQQQDTSSITSDQVSRSAYQDLDDYSSGLAAHHARINSDGRLIKGNRLRAVSANDAEGLKFDPNTLNTHPTPNIGTREPSPAEESQFSLRLVVPDDPSLLQPGPTSPTVSITPPVSEPVSRTASPTRSRINAPTADFLAPPGANGAPSRQLALSPNSQETPTITVPQRDWRSSRRQGSGSSSRRDSSPPLSHFPRYTDDPFDRQSQTPSLFLPAPSASGESLLHPVEYPGLEPRPLWWWPYSVLPSPNILLSTLFPTLYNWGDKNWWERLLGIVSAPSVFLLTITLPIVESQRDDDAPPDDDIPPLSMPGSLVPTADGFRRSRANTLTITEPNDPLSPGTSFLQPTGISSSRVDISSGIAGHGSTAGVATSTEQHYHHRNQDSHQNLLASTPPQFLQSPEQLPIAGDREGSEPGDWNRWLVFVQTFSAPLFVVVILWANMDPDEPRLLFRMVMFSLLGSLVILGLLLASTTAEHPPRWRVLLCFAGFIVSIAWISTIANEVVGVLKTIGVVLNISDAILGLTIFAVGNSLGDLVANITVARLGFPVMALSACFGGPMLNILLGIGLSGSYISITGARHKHHKHPGRPIHFAPYHVEISGTLLISGITLLVTLVGLLVFVPLRRWKMDRAIGIGLVTLWAISTVGNVIAEVLGWGKQLS